MKNHPEGPTLSEILIQRIVSITQNFYQHFYSIDILFWSFAGKTFDRLLSMDDL